MNIITSQRVLIVDDDEVVLDVYRRMLGRQFDIRLARGAKQAMEALTTEGPFAVIMSDLRMPGVRGIDLLREVRTRWPNVSRILVTGDLDVPEIDGDVELATLVRKPCPPPELAAILKRAINAYSEKELSGESL